MNSKGKKGRERENPSTKKSIFEDNMLQSGLQDYKKCSMQKAIEIYRNLV